MRTIRLLAVLALAAAVHAAPSARYAAWAKSPVKWIMTADDQRAWRSIDSDADAQKFIALFWARRDPSPGTPENEYRNEFDRRVGVADALFTRGGTRGALTDPGRVLIALGPPDANRVPSYASGHAGINRHAPQAVGYFHYEQRVALHLTSDLRFVALADGPFVLSPQGNIFGALDDAVRGAIVSPQLRDVPPWAPSAPAFQRFQITLLHASASKPLDPPVESFPAGVDKAVDDVRAVLPFKTYRFSDTIGFDAKRSEAASVTMYGTGETRYDVSLRFDDAGATLDVSPFRVARADGPEVLSTSFAIKPGETVSVGASRNKDAKDALLFFVTWVAEP